MFAFLTLRTVGIAVLVIAAVAVPTISWLLSALPTETDPCRFCGGDCNNPNPGGER